MAAKRRPDVVIGYPGAMAMLAENLPEELKDHPFLLAICVGLFCRDAENLQLSCLNMGKSLRCLDADEINLAPQQILHSGSAPAVLHDRIFRFGLVLEFNRAHLGRTSDAY